MTEPPEVEPTACAVCGHVVSVVTRGAEIVGYRHGLERDEDHPVIPVPVSSIRTEFVCDFCSAPGARWSLPVEPYEMTLPLAPPPGWSGPEMPATMNTDNWAACDGCAAAIRAGDWGKVVYRSDRAQRDRGSQLKSAESRAILQHTYRELRQHITGPIRLRVDPIR